MSADDWPEGTNEIFDLPTGRLTCSAEIDCVGDVCAVCVATSQNAPSPRRTL